MGSNTKIIVLHMKEIIYTIIFAILAIVLILLLVFMFRPKDTQTSNNMNHYNPGVYSSSLSLNNTNLEVEVTVDKSHINSIRFSNLDESVTTMFPLIQPAMEDIADQICKTQSLENITLSENTPYTSQVIINAISDALTKAGAN